jgi:hypothetical protein
MPCIHKFASDLNLERIAYEPTTLIVGTFNPDWDNLGNYAQWFYGRTQNNYFWDVLPRLYGENPLRQASASEWKAFCKRHKIALTDLIFSINDADNDNIYHIDYLKNYRDDLIAKHFRQFTFTDIPRLLAKHPTIRHVYLTRSINDPFWRRLWQPVESHCQKHGIKTKTLLTPSGGARFQLPKGVKVSLVDFIFEQWQRSWHSL